MVIHLRQTHVKVPSSLPFVATDTHRYCKLLSYSNSKLILPQIEALRHLPYCSFPLPDLVGGPSSERNQECCKKGNKASECALTNAKCYHVLSCKHTHIPRRFKRRFSVL